jgi:PAS domain S-box-containing protein
MTSLDAVFDRQNLWDADAQYLEILESLPTAVYATDAEGVVTFFNRAAAELAGREPRIGKDKWCISWRLYRPDGSLLPHQDCPMARTLKDRRPVRGEEVIAERPDGTRIPLMPFPTPIFDRGGRMVGAVNMLVDNSERRNAIVQLEASEARYRGIFDGSRVALWDEDFSAVLALLDGLRASGVTDVRAYFSERPQELAEAVRLVHVRDVNDYTVELFEAGEKSALLGALGAIFVDATNLIFLDELVALWEGKRRFESESLVRTLKGRDLTVLLTISWEGERCERSLVSIIDVSKQKAVERRLELLNRVAITLSSQLDLERIVQTVTDTATAVSGARFGAFFYNVLDEDGERYVLYTLSGAPREAFEKFGVPRNTAVFDATFHGTGIVRSDDIRKDPRYGNNPPHHGMPEGHLPVVSYLAVPVVSRSGEVLGGLFFGHDEPGVFSEDSEKIVAGIAAHAAIAIDNSNLLLEAHREIDYRRRAEEAQRRLAMIVESSDDAIISKDLKSTIVSWNLGAERLFGYTADEVVGKPITVLFPPGREDEEPPILERILRGEPIDHYDTVRRKKDGTLIDVSLTVSPVKDSEGRIVGASKIARDISERKRTERALAKSVREQATLYRFTDRLHRARSVSDVYDAAFDAIADGLGCDRASILLFDRSRTMRFVASRGLSEEYRRAVDGHSPWSPDVLFPSPLVVEDVERSDLSDELKATIRSEGIAALAFIPLMAPSRLIGKFMTYYPEPHEFSEQELGLALTIARQLSFGLERARAEEERARFEESLLESEERLEMALNAGQMGAWEWNVSTGRIVWSPSLERIHGLESGTFGGTFEDFKRDIHRDDLPRVLAAIDRAVSTLSDYHVAYRMNHPSGAVRWLEASGRFAPGSAGAERRLVGICTDITERRDTEAQRDLLLAELSHRVKNTLATVISIARQSFARNQNVDDVIASFDARIRGLAQTHTRLAEASWSGVSFETMLNDELVPYRREDGSNIRISGPPVRLSPRSALTLGMAIHELATNAAKHGALSSKKGVVDVAWHLDPARQLHIAWTESGGPAVGPPERSGFGRLLLERALASDLHGDVRLDFARSGLICTICLPLEEGGASFVR